MTDRDDNLPAFHRAVIAPLVADTIPVRRLWPVSRRLGAWTALAAFCAVVFLATQGNPDGHGVAADLHAVWLAAASALTAAVLAWLTLRSAIPGCTTVRHTSLVLMPLGFVVMLALTRPPDASGTVALFATAASRCAMQIFAVSLLPAIALALAALGAAPLRPRLTLATAGGSAFLVGAAAVTLLCPIDTRYHVLIAHFSPGMLAAATGAWLGSWRAGL